jgi:hypothetical protein
VVPVTTSGAQMNTNLFSMMEMWPMFKLTKTQLGKRLPLKSLTMLELVVKLH